MKYAIALLALISLAGRASAGDCVLPKPPLLGALGQWARDAAARMDSTVYEQRRREREQRATYEALLAAGAPEQWRAPPLSIRKYFRQSRQPILGIRADAALHLAPAI
jgi:hypothetical protein